MNRKGRKDRKGLITVLTMHVEIMDITFLNNEYCYIPNVSLQ